MKHWIPKPIRKRIRDVTFTRSPVPWANLGQASSLIAALIPTDSPPVLILSFPRSGSSWVGEAMGHSRTSLYLREPITQTYLSSRDGKGPVCFEVEADSLPPTYKPSADDSFAGLPVFQPRIVKSAEQWALRERTTKRVVIKEVSPLAINWFVDTFQPRIIYLVRHPAAVANSFFKLGWTEKLFERKFSLSTLASMDFNYRDFVLSFWMEHGAFQAVVLRRSLEVLREYPEKKIVKYEDLCSDPMGTFRGLFSFTSLNWSSEIEELVMALSTSREPYAAGQYGVHRNSRTLIKRWKIEIPKEEIRRIKESYLFFDPPYYQSEEW